MSRNHASWPSERVARLVNQSDSKENIEMEHDSSSRSGYHEPEPGYAGLDDEGEDWGDDFPKTFSVNLIWAQASDLSLKPI